MPEKVLELQFLQCNIEDCFERTVDEASATEHRLYTASRVIERGILGGDSERVREKQSEIICRDEQRAGIMDLILLNKD